MLFRPKPFFGLNFGGTRTLWSGMGLIAGAVAVFLLDSVFVLARVLFSSRCGAVDLLLLAGRLVGGSFLAALALRLVKGRWPCRWPWSHCRTPTESTESRQSTQVRARPLLDVELNSNVSEQQQQLKRKEKGEKWSSLLLFLAFFYLSACSLRVALEVVTVDVSSFWNSLWVVIEILSLPIMQLEFVFIKGLVEEMSAGDGVKLSLHEHLLYWNDVENKGFVECSVCNEKVGERTGGFLVVQCRQCTGNEWGHGGFQVCTCCFRKNARGGSAGGLLRGDKGPKHMARLTVMQYIRRLAAQVQVSTLAMVAISVACSQSLNAYIPKTQGDIITALTTGSKDSFDHYLTDFACLVVAQAVAATALSVTSRALSARLFSDMSIKLFASLLKQDIAFYDHTMTGQMSARLFNDMRQATSPVHIIIHDFAANIVMLVAGFVICLQSSWRLTVLAFTVLTPVLHISREFSRWARKLMASQHTFICDAHGCAIQALTNIRTVRTFGAKGMELEKFQFHMQKFKDLGVKSAWGEGSSNLLSTLVQQGASFIILWYGGHLALKQEFPVGAIITFTYLWNRLSTAFTSLTDNLNEPVKAVSAGQRVFELMDLEPDIAEEGGEPFPSSKVGISFRNVDFSYQCRPDKKVLGGVTLDLEAGKTTAVVGKSGCGKSTLSKLLLRFYDPVKGAVYLNGVDLQQLHLLQYRANVGVVSQDTQLFRSSVSENITYGLRATEYTLQDVERAASLANADEFIRSLPEGRTTQESPFASLQVMSLAKCLQQVLMTELRDCTKAMEESQSPKTPRPSTPYPYPYPIHEPAWTFPALPPPSIYPLTLLPRRLDLLPTLPLLTYPAPA